ncbi:hypothetical protein MMPV_006105 [Pyropia vietnamensis]
MAADNPPPGVVNGADAEPWHNPAEAGAVIPWLSTDDMPASLALYVDALHFSIVFSANAAHAKRVPPNEYPRGEVALAMLRLGPAALLLQAEPMVPAVVRGAWGHDATDHETGAAAAASVKAGASSCRGAGVSLYLLGLDPDGLLPGLPAEVRVLQQPVTQQSGMREAVVVDPVNGYVITVAKIAGVSAAEHLLGADPPPRVTLLTAAPTLKVARVAAAVTRRLAVYDLIESPADGSFAAAAGVAAGGSGSGSCSGSDAAARAGGGDASVHCHDSGDAATAEAAAVAAAADASGSTVRRATVTAIHPVARAVTLSTGARVPYDALIIATGAHPAVPPPLTVLTLRDGDSVARLTAAVAGARTVGLVGNGGIAMELAWALTDAQVVWVVRDGHVGGGVVDAAVGRVLARRLEADRRGSEEARGGALLQDSDTNVMTVQRPAAAMAELPVQAHAADPRGVGAVPGLGAKEAPGGRAPHGGAVGPDWLSGRDSRYGTAATRPVLAGKGGGAKFGGIPPLRIIFHAEVAAASWDAAAAAAGGDPPLTLCLTTGEEVAVDVVIAATGVVPAVELAIAAGIAVDGQEGATGATSVGRSAAKAGDLTSPPPATRPQPMAAAATATAAAAVSPPSAPSASPASSSTAQQPPSRASPNPCPGGILVRAPSMATSAPGVYAAGDCTTVVTATASASGAPSSLWHQMRLWGQARVAGVAAARSAARAAARHAAATAAASAEALAAAEESHTPNGVDTVGTPAAAAAATTSAGDGHRSVEESNGEAEEEEEDDMDMSFELFAHVTWFMGAKVVLLGRHDGRGLPPGYTVYEADGAEGGEGGPGSWARAVVSAAGRLVGGVLVGETGLEEAYENLMLDGLDVSGVGGALVAGGGVDIADYYD